MGNEGKEYIIGIVCIGFSVIFFDERYSVLPDDACLYVGQFQGILRMGNFLRVITVNGFYQLICLDLCLFKGLGILLLQVVILRCIAAFFNLLHLIIIKKDRRTVKLVKAENKH